MAWVLSNPPYNYNTRSCGTDKLYANIDVTKKLLQWADEIVCANKEHMDYIRARLRDLGRVDLRVFSLDIPDRYAYRNDRLIELIKERYGRN